MRIGFSIFKTTDERASNKKQIAMVKTSASLYGFTLVNLLDSKIFAIVH